MVATAKKGSRKFGWHSGEVTARRIKTTEDFVVDGFNVDASGNATVHAAAAGTSGAQTISTAFTNPVYPRNLTVTLTHTSGTNTGTTTVTGTDIDGNVITEDFGPFASATATFIGSKVFSTVTSYTIPATVTSGATVAVGSGVKLPLTRKIASLIKLTKDGAAVTGGTTGTIDQRYNTIDVGTTTTSNKIMVVYKSF